MASEKEKMLSGAPYNPFDQELIDERTKTRELILKLNNNPRGKLEIHRKLLSQLLPNCEQDIYIEPPFYCDYGYNIYTGRNVYFNYNCVVLDVCSVTIGSNVLFGPGVHIYTATHPTEASERRRGWEFGKPVSIGDDCWIGGHAVVLPGVTIGHRCIVGAGSVVSRDVLDDMTVIGNPAK
jgi:maltose O-acetyltransferase